MIQRQSKGLGLVLMLVVAVGYTWATWNYFTRPVPGGNDFLAHYTAWEAYLKYGFNPYSDEAALHTQRVIYGRLANPSEDQNRLTYPFYSILLHAPFVLINDHAVARAVYMTLLQAALFAGVIMTLSLVGWQPPLWLFAITLTWSLLYYPEARGVILGQFAIFGFFALAGALLLLRQGRDAASGALLVLSTFKPTLVFLVVPFLLMWAMARRRWRFMAGFLGTLFILVLGSWFVLPTWMGDWLNRIGQYSDYTVGQSPVWLLTHSALPALGQVGEGVIVKVLLAGMVWSWWHAIRSREDKEFYWSLGVTLVVSNLVVSRSATTNYVMLLVPTLWLFAAFDRVPRWGRPTVLAVMFVSVVGLWWLHVATVVGNQEQPIMFLPSPLALGLVLMLGRAWLLRDAVMARVIP